MSHGLLRAYLLALVAQRAKALLSSRGCAMKISFTGGPWDGDEQTNARRKDPLEIISLESTMLRDLDEKPLIARYMLVGFNEETLTASYYFAGWKERVP